MRIPLQNLDQRSSKYERPNQDWVCGWAKDGRPCPLGPNAKGQCTAHGQASCSPVRDGDRYVCTRPDVFGGPCTDGPRPDGSCACPEPEHQVCQPVRSLRAKRGLFVRLSMIFALGVLIIGIAGPWSMDFVSPGPLGASHMAIQGPGDENCGACHVAEGASFGSWLGAALMTTMADGHGGIQSEQCLDCHFRTPESREVAMNVHSRSLIDVDSIEAAASATPVMTAGFTSAQVGLTRALHGKEQFGAAGIACASCHEEHLGRSHDMTAMSDAQCQVCHSEPFESFNQGHPEFGAIERPMVGISFNHHEHETHFPNEELVCESCHMPDPLGRTMAVASFEQACKGCHAQGSEDHHGDGIKRNSMLFAQLPAFEFEEEVYWPSEGAWGEFLSPMMLLLLAGDDEAVPLLYSIYNDAFGDLYEWSFVLEDNDELYLKAELATSIKAMVAELADYSDEGVEARNARLARALGVPGDDPAVQNLNAELASASFVMQMFKQRYLPQLDDDLAGEPVDASADESMAADWMTSKNMSGWHIDSGAGTISYRPVVHADPLLKHWIEAVFTHADDKGEADSELESQRQFLRGKVYERIEADFKACTRCHAQGDDGIQWAAAGRQYGASGFVKFNHAPHMAMLNQGDTCSTCHVPSDVEATDEHAMVRGFAPHEKAVCESCHTETGADNTCLNCHQYHELRP